MTRLWRPMLPASLMITAAAMVAFEESELGRPHQVDFKIENDTGEQVCAVLGVLQAQRPERLEPGEITQVAVVQPFGDAAVETFGRYRLTMSIDVDHVSWSTDFWVLHPEEALIPPL